MRVPTERRQDRSRSAFLTRNPCVVAIPKGSTSQHVEENAGAADVHLTEEELAQIDKAFPLGKSKGLPML